MLKIDSPETIGLKLLHSRSTVEMYILLSSNSKFRRYVYLENQDSDTFLEANFFSVSESGIGHLGRLRVRKDLKITDRDGRFLVLDERGERFVYSDAEFTTILFDLPPAWSFHANGIYSFPSGLEEVTLQELRRLVHANPHERISNLFEMSPLFAPVLDNPMLKSILAQIYPGGYHLTTYSSNTLRKGVDKQGWHVDYPYHDIHPLNWPSLQEEPFGIQVNIALDDFTETNGATQYIEGSHHFRNVPFGNMSDFQKLYRKTVVPAGTMILYIGSLWHSQGVNETDSPRAALLSNFAPLSIPAKGKMVEQKGMEPFRYVDGKYVF